MLIINKFNQTTNPIHRENIKKNAKIQYIKLLDQLQSTIHIESRKQLNYTRINL